MTKEVDLDKIPLGTLEFHPTAGDYFAEALKEQEVEYFFGVHGGDCWLVIDPASRLGIKIITFHHEQSALYAADAYARVARKPGVAFFDTGPGTTNMASGLQQAFLACSPVVVISGSTIGGHDGLYTWQPSYADKMFGHITKWVRKAHYPQAIKRLLAEAFRDVQTYPKGPAIIEYPLWTFNIPVPPPSVAFLFQDHIAYVPRWRGDETSKPLPPTQGDPEMVEKVVRRIMEGKRPLLVVGDGVHQADASAELVEFIELAQVPGAGRRTGRGAIPETHPLNCRFESFANVADPMITIGLKVGAFEGWFGLGWPGTIQINESEQQIASSINTELVIIGNPKLVLRQMIDCIKAKGFRPPPDRAQWIEEVQKSTSQGRENLLARAEKYKNHKPVHHGYMSKVMAETVEDLYGGTNRIILDGFTISSFAPGFFKARYSGQILDAAEQAGVGHSIGMSIGAGFADPETKKRPTLCLLGDAGFGVAAMDVETALRYETPAVYLVCNNNGWMSSVQYIHYTKGWKVMGPQDRPWGMQFLPGIRYDKIAEMFPGVHGEYVEEPDQFRPALERAFRSAEKGKPAVINVQVEPSIINTGVYAPASSLLDAHIPYKELPKRGKALRRYNLGQELPILPFDEYGIPPVPQPDPWEPVTDEEAEP
jgi:acetolactate synthase-1/2/3 large subunit